MTKQKKIPVQFLFRPEVKMVFTLKPDGSASASVRAPVESGGKQEHGATQFLRRKADGTVDGRPGSRMFDSMAKRLLKGQELESSLTVGLKPEGNFAVAIGRLIPSLSAWEFVSESMKLADEQDELTALKIALGKLLDPLDDPDEKTLRRRAETLVDDFLIMKPDHVRRFIDDAVRYALEQVELRREAKRQMEEE